MATDQTEINSAVAQQVDHTAQPTERNPQPEAARFPAAAVAKPASDLRAFRNAVACALRPYPIDDADPRGSKRRVAIAFGGFVVVLALLVGLSRAR